MVAYWDERKNRAHRKRHGLSFELASRCFKDPFAVTVEDYIDDNGVRLDIKPARWLGTYSYSSPTYIARWTAKKRLGSSLQGRQTAMKKKSTGRTEASIKREVEALKKIPDSAIDYSEIPRQDPDDPKWKNAVIGKFYRPIKRPIALRLDADVIAWLKSQGDGYQSRINDILRREMVTHLKR